MKKDNWIPLWLEYGLKFTLFMLLLWLLNSCSLFRRSGEKKLQDILEQNPGLVKTDSTQTNVRIKIAETTVDTSLSVSRLALKPYILDNPRMNIKLNFLNDSTITLNARSKGIDTSVVVTKHVYDFSNYQTQAETIGREYKAALNEERANTAKWKWFVVGMAGFILLILGAVVMVLLAVFKKKMVSIS